MAFRVTTSEVPECIFVILEFTFNRYHADNRNLAYGEFRFGPLFVRLCYELGLEEMAAATLTDKVNHYINQRLDYGQMRVRRTNFDILS